MWFTKKYKIRIEQLEAENSKLKESCDKLSKYEAITNVQDEIDKIQQKSDEEILRKERKIKSLESEYESLKSSYDLGLKTYDHLKGKCDAYHEELDLISYGIYEPHFNFDTSEQYKEKIQDLRTAMKDMVKLGHAAIGGELLTLDGSKLKGQTSARKIKKLMLRAFNGECDSLVANVSWNNIDRYLSRMEKSFDIINNNSPINGIFLSVEYLNLRLDELKATYEYKLKCHEEREEQRAIKEQIREEERARREYEKAKIEAEKERQIYLRALEKTRKEIGHASGEKLAQLQEKIAKLEAGLIGAEEVKQRAISMAEQTKMGYVYIISNIGSFGDDIYKIGLTRRLEPLDRVRELGDASVPFPFDVHAMIFSEDAPSLESSLHKKFNEKRVNRINFRKEFFNVSLKDIEKEAQRLGAKIEFTMLAEAKEYKQSLKEKEKANVSQSVPQKENLLPSSI